MMLLAGHDDDDDDDDIDDNIDEDVDDEDNLPATSCVCAAPIPTTLCAPKKKLKT